MTIPMNKLLLLPLALGLFVFSSCETKQFEVQTNTSFDLAFLIDDNGTFDSQEIVTESDILGIADLPDDAVITNIEIAANPRPRIRVIPLDQQGNQATDLDISGYLEDSNGQQNLFSSESISVAVDGNDASFENINSLVANGFQAFRDKLNDYVDLVSIEDFVVGIQGTATPTGAQIRALATLRVTLTITYVECVEVPMGLGDNECAN